MAQSIGLTKRLLCRCYHMALRFALFVYPIPRPKCYKSAQLDSWLAELKQQGIERLLVVTDKTLLTLDIAAPVITALESAGIRTSIYSDILPDPDINEIESGFMLYIQDKCQGIVAIGGGSVIDGAKLIGVRAAKPHKTLTQLRGLFKVMRRLPPLTAVPTTAGTGSETTVAAVVSNRKQQDKFAIADYCLAPKYALLMPELSQGLPPFITATTAMDALTHAIEAFIGINGTQFTNQKALSACKLIFENFPLVLQEPSNIKVRENLLNASFYAGEAFTRTSVGYVHAIAHQLGAKYHVAHGLANAVLLDVVLTEYGETIHDKLARIADYCELGNNKIDDRSQKAALVIEKIRELRGLANLTTKVDELDATDIPDITTAAMKEAHPDYPVPEFWSSNRFDHVLQQVLT
mgnify:FL=1